MHKGVKGLAESKVQGRDKPLFITSGEMSDLAFLL